MDGWTDGRLAGWPAGWLDGEFRAQNPFGPKSRCVRKFLKPCCSRALRVLSFQVFEFSRVLCKPGCMQTIERTRMDTLYEHCMNMGMRASAWEQTCQGSRGRGGTLCEAAAGGPI
uniref:Uncharacterized protein n=1 Tax=Chlamydomonas euryale TaxID=1486919 RepID=A0A7R9YS46_9CHLO|mmetsp:Transcript_16477/g.49079  ORF Transcript_16477/g.49079 Transcript_16477/m.49079 type:complete len:115 (+) Transcript_16477:171-515(+)